MAAHFRVDGPAAATVPRARLRRRFPKRIPVSLRAERGKTKDYLKTKAENKKLRFREQRFATDPLLRRRRLDMLSPDMMKVLVVALQNELAAQNSIMQQCHLAQHPVFSQHIPGPSELRVHDLKIVAKKADTGNQGLEKHG